ncbi:MAG TPA: histidine kinase dimerization/phosphoacceptor domain-containing protein, partial [Thermoleophilaceae bacterium]|nr:histidine kinase dimerization/phosphoacceptor domain-containing protein [Thermoleophilaceae bacterium]
MAGLGATAVAAVITSTSVQGEGAALAGLARASMVAAPIGVGLYAWHSRPDDRFGRLLVAAGFGWFLTTFAETSDELLYSIGRVAGWAVEVGLIGLILAFPSGRLTARADRLLLGAAAAIFAVLYLPTTLLVETFPVPSQFTSCHGGCPGNAFQIGTEPAFLGDVVVPLREALTTLVFLAVTARVAQRVRGAGPLTRLTLLPVLVVAATRWGLLALGIVLRRAAPDSPLVEAVVWAAALAVPAVAVAFLVGLLQRRLYEAGALQQLGTAARGAADREQLRAVLSTAVGDPSLELVYRAEGPPRWVDGQGRPSGPPGRGRCLTEVRQNGHAVVGLVHEEALLEEADFLEAASSYALTALENRRLSAQVEASLDEVRRSRTRIQASGDRERRRIERDLHDGAQQRLVALGIQLELTEDLIRDDRERGLERLHALGEELGRTLEEIQALGRGVYPSLLADRGLGEALRAAALRLPLAATVEADGAGRYPAEVENAVYFC